MNDCGIEVQFQVGVEIYFFSQKTFISALRSTPSPIQWVLGSLSPGIRPPVREAVHSRPSSADVILPGDERSTSSHVFIT
jgi:hypothetical protein